MSDINDRYTEIFSRETIYQVLLNVFAIILTTIVMYFISAWFAGVIFYILFIFIFCLFYLAIRIILLKIRIYKQRTNRLIRLWLGRAIESEDIIVYKKLLVLNAFNMATYGDDDKKRLGIRQLEQYYREPEYAYRELSNVLESKLGAPYEKLITELSNRICKLKWVQVNKEKLRKYRIKRNLKEVIEKEEYDKYQKKLIENALEKSKSRDKNERKVGLEQLSQFGEEYAYVKLLEIIKYNELDKLHEKQIVETLYKILNNVKNRNT